MFDITDRPGCISKEKMRQCFEAAVAQTAVLKTSTPLGAVTMNGKFSHYANSETDTMWLGFALGMRCAERLFSSADA